MEPDEGLSLFVKRILIFEEQEDRDRTVLPFYADGYPGLIFQQSTGGLEVYPQDKVMPDLFLYGQTIHPVELVIHGRFKLIVFQLYPFVIKSLFDVEPRSLNDDCCDVSSVLAHSGYSLTDIKTSRTTTLQVDKILLFLYSLFKKKKNTIDPAVAIAVNRIIEQNGLVKISSLPGELQLTQRTLERRFARTVGITAKQFASIIQFQRSLEQLTLKDYATLTDIVYANGFSDQSHFIKVFKAFTGTTPAAFRIKS